MSERRSEKQDGHTTTQCTIYFNKSQEDKLCSKHSETKAQTWSSLSSCLSLGCESSLLRLWGAALAGLSLDRAPSAERFKGEERLCRGLGDCHLEFDMKWNKFHVDVLLKIIL